MSSSSPSLSASPSPDACSPLSLSRASSSLSTSSLPSIQVLAPTASVLPGAADSALLSALAAIQMHSTQLAQIQAQMSSSPPLISSSSSSSAPPQKLRRPPRSSRSSKQPSASASPPLVTAQQAQKSGSDSGASGSESDYDANSNNNNYSVNHHQPQSSRQLPSLPRKNSVPVQGSTFIGRVAADLLLLPWNKLLAALLCTFFIWLSFTRIADFQTRVERLSVENMELRNYASALINKESKRIEKHLSSLELRMIEKLQKEVGALVTRIETIATRGHEMDKRIAAHELKSNFMQHAISSRLGEGSHTGSASIIQTTARTTADVRHQIVDDADGVGPDRNAKNGNAAGRRELPSGIPDVIPVPPHSSSSTATGRARASSRGEPSSETDMEDISAAAMSGMDATYSATLAKHLRDATRVVIEEERVKLQATLRAQAMKRDGSVGDDDDQTKERDLDAEDLAYQQAEERLRQMREKTEL